MGIFARVFGKRDAQEKTARAYKTFTEYAPSFSTWNGRIYEQELTRAAIERFATACGKLRPEIEGNESARPLVTAFVKGRPNGRMTWPTFLKRAAALYESYGTLLVVPTLSRDFMDVTGIWPMAFDYAEVVDLSGEPWLRIYLPNGDVSAIELKSVAIVNKFQVQSDLFGEPNCLDTTLKLLHAQAEAEDNAIKNGAKIRFIGALNGMVREDDMKKKRDRFVEENLSSDNAGGLMVYDQTFANVTQVNSSSWTIDAKEMDRIQQNVYNYFGINERILQNSFTEENWDAYYEAKVEPFAISLGEGITHMCFGQTQIKRGCRVTFSTNRLEYAAAASKRAMVRDMMDRGVMTVNEARDVLQLPPIPGGDVFMYRGEYIMSDVNGNVLYEAGGARGDGGNGRHPMNNNDGDRDLGGDDAIYSDSDVHNTVDSDE